MLGWRLEEGRTVGRLDPEGRFEVLRAAGKGDFDEIMAIMCVADG
jgi:hypothetical protein